MALRNLRADTSTLPANYPALQHDPTAVQNGRPVFSPTLVIDDATGIIYAGRVPINTPGQGGGGAVTEATVLVVDNSDITLDATQAAATVLILQSSGGGPSTNFTVLNPVSGPKAPFAVQNTTGQTAVIGSTAQGNFLAVLAGEIGTFFMTSTDIQSYGEVLFIENQQAHTNAGGIDLNSNTIVGYSDQGAGSFQLRKAGGTGGNLVDFPALTGSVGTLRNKTLLIYVAGGMTKAWASFLPTGFGFQVCVKTGILTIGHARLITTGPLDMHVSARTGLIKFNGVDTNIVIDATGGIQLVTCDNTTLSGIDISNGNDWYLAIYFADVAGNDTVTVGQATGGVNVPETLAAGDLVNTSIGANLNGGTPVSSYASHTLVTWIEDTGV